MILSSIYLQGVVQEILPCGQGRIDSVKINPSLLMMTDWAMPNGHPSSHNEHTAGNSMLMRQCTVTNQAGKH